MSFLANSYLERVFLEEVDKRVRESLGQQRAELSEAHILSLVHAETHRIVARIVADYSVDE